METKDDLRIQFILKASDIKPNVNVEKFLTIYASDKYTNTIHEGRIIIHIFNVKLIEPIRILTNGMLKYTAKIECTVLNPVIGEVVKIHVTSVNKMGAIYKNLQMTIFVPKHLCENEILPLVGTSIMVKIVGKRIEDKILCIGSMIDLHE